MCTAHHYRDGFAMCFRNDDYAASLELCKVYRVYRVMDDTDVDQRDHVRVIDESGEDYLFPTEYFVPITLPEAAEKVFRATS